MVGEVPRPIEADGGQVIALRGAGDFVGASLPLGSYRACSGTAAGCSIWGRHAEARSLEWACDACHIAEVFN